VNRVMKHLNGTEYNKEFSGMWIKRIIR
jgi:hypothetical protein